MKTLLLVALALIHLAASAATFNLREDYGAAHSEQIVRFAYTAGKLTYANTKVTGPSGVEVPWAQANDGSVLVQTNLPASTIAMVFSCGNTRTGNTIEVNGRYTGIQLDPAYNPRLLKLSWTTSAPGGLTNDGFYWIKTYDTNGTAASFSATPGGAEITLTSNGVGTCTATTAGWTVDAATDTFTQASHGYIAGNRWACTTNGTAPTGLTCDGAAAYYVGNITTDTFTVHTTYANAIAGTSPVDITAAGTAVNQSLIDWTWTTSAGPTTVFIPTNPVVIKTVGANWEITNGLTGVCVPTTAGNGSPFDLSPIQCVQLADGGRVATGPNYLYARDSGDPGNLINTTLQTRAGYLITAYRATVIQSNALETVIVASYATNRPHYQYGTTVDIPSGVGYFTSKITLQANQPMALFDDSYDTQLQYFVNTYPALTDKPDVYRWLGGSATSVLCGHDISSVLYTGVNSVRNTPAYRDLDYTQDVQAGTSCTATTYKRLDPLITYSGDDSGWYQMEYKASGSSTSPLIGIFVGQLSKYVTPSGTGTGDLSTPGLFTSNSHFTTSAIAGGVHLYNGVWAGATNPARSWGLYVSTKADLAAAGIQQPIQRTMNLISGINLSSLYSYTLSFSNPGGGFTSPWVSESVLANTIAKIRDGTTAPSCGSADCYYNKINGIGAPHEIVTMWRANSAAGIDTALNGAVIPINYLGYIMTHGNGATRDGVLPFSNASVVWTPLVSRMMMALRDSNTTLSQQTRAKSFVALLGSMQWDNNFIPLDSNGFRLGTSNQAIQMVQLRATLANVIPTHPLMATKLAAAKASTLSQIAAVTNSYGAPIAGPWYFGASWHPTTANLALAANLGQYSFAETPSLGAVCRAELASVTPPEVRFGATVRKMFSIADGNTFSGAVLGTCGTMLNATDPTLANRAMWAYAKQNTSTTITHDLGAVPTFLEIDDTLTQTDPVITSATFPGAFSHARYGWQTNNETALWFVNGDYYNDHRHCDQGQVSIYALGAPLAIDWNANLYYPPTEACYSHNAVVLDADLPGAYNAASPSMASAGGMTNSFVASAQTEFFAGSKVTYSRATFTAADNTVWTRQVITDAGTATHPVISTLDSFTGTRAADAKTLTWNMMATGAVTIPGGTFTPTTKFSSGCQNPPGQLPGGGTSVALASGLNEFTFTGATWVAVNGINWRFYTDSNVSTQHYFIDNWGHGCHNDREANEFSATNSFAFEERQHIFRLNGTGSFATYHVPYAKGGTAPTTTKQSCGLQVVYGSETSCRSATEYTFTDGTTSCLASFDTASHTAFTVTVSGGPVEVCVTSTTATVTTSGVTASTRTITLPVASTWYPSTPIGKSGSNWTQYHPGGAQPVVYTASFSTTPATVRVIPFSFTAPSGTASVRVKVGGNYVGSAACSVSCFLELQMNFPTGTQSAIWEFLNSSGVVIATSEAVTI
jgi:hypothetical protein